MARVVGHTRTKVRIELRLPAEEWTRFLARYESEGLALRALRLLFEDSFRLAQSDLSVEHWDRVL
jgi:hypothetical protein